MNTSEAIATNTSDPNLESAVNTQMNDGHSTDRRPVLTVIMPAFNEATTIDEAIRRVLDGPYDKELVIVNDGSIDGTAEILSNWENTPCVTVIHHHTNRGKGAAIRTGLRQAQGHFTIIQDADLEYDPHEYSRLVEPLLHGQAQVVYGSRFARCHGQTRPPRRLFDYGVWLINICVRLTYGVRLTDEATCYKAFSTSLLRALDLQCEHFEFCPEVTAKVCRMALQIHEVPISYRPRGKQQGKKIRIRDGWEAIATLWKWRRWQGSWKPPVHANGVGTV